MGITALTLIIDPDLAFEPFDPSKVDALARYLQPEENQTKGSKSLLERMLADLDPPKKRKGRHVKHNAADPDAPKAAPR